MEKTPQTFGEYLKSYFRNLKELARHPQALLPTIIITAIWIALGFLKKGMKESPVSISLCMSLSMNAADSIAAVKISA